MARGRSALRNGCVRTITVIASSLHLLTVFDEAIGWLTLRPLSVTVTAISVASDRKFGLSLSVLIVDEITSGEPGRTADNRHGSTLFDGALGSFE